MTYVPDPSKADGRPVQSGSALVPAGAVYDGSGQYTLSGLTAGTAYLWVKGANDISIVNTPDTITVSGTFLAAGTSCVMNGTPGATVTATVQVVDTSYVLVAGSTMTGNLRFTAGSGVVPEGVSGEVFMLGSNLRVASDGLQVKFPDSTWHKLLAVQLDDQYVLDTEQAATP